MSMSVREKTRIYSDKSATKSAAKYINGKNDKKFLIFSNKLVISFY